MRVIVDRLSKSYRDRSGQNLVALNGIGLTVEPEEFVAILGPSGCGKSTLLNIIAGLLPASSGEVVFEGERRPGQPLTATVFQEFALFPWRTAQANVEFGLEELNLSPAERKERSARFIAMTGLEGFEGKFPHQLSGGMRQRVAVARGLAVDPKLLLLDEPFSALDALTRGLLQDELARIWMEQRKTVVMITNDVEEAIRLAQRIYPLTPGPGATLGPEIPVPIPHPRSRRLLSLDPVYQRVRRELTEFLIKSRNGRGTSGLASSTASEVLR
jgi:ABC-type nitrate/sulfonate/bicarbonate transport system ATPase subunit